MSGNNHKVRSEDNEVAYYDPFPDGLPLDAGTNGPVGKGKVTGEDGYEPHVWTEAELVALRAKLEAFSGDELLDYVAGFLGRYLVLPSPEALDAVTLWIGHTHAIQHFDSTPRLTLVSPEKQCGKTRTTELVEMLARKTLSLVNSSTAAIFRSIETYHPTLIVDEADTIFLGKSSESHDDLRGILNSGHRRGKNALRMVGTTEVKTFETFCPVLLCSIRDLPDTIMDRSVVIRMRRRARDESVEKFLFREATPEGDLLCDVLAQWAVDAAEKLAAVPTLPAGLTDRPADVWEPLLAVADAAGGHWPQRARKAALKLINEPGGDDTWGITLLGDIRALWAGLPAEAPPYVHTESLLRALTLDDESPWRTIQKGHELDARGLAWWLKPYAITSKNVRVGNTVKKGYTWTDFEDAWSRYLPEL